MADEITMTKLAAPERKRTYHYVDDMADLTWWLVYIAIWLAAWLCKRWEMSYERP